jgi:hypothetical protein
VSLTCMGVAWPTCRDKVDRAVAISRLNRLYSSLCFGRPLTSQEDQDVFLGQRTKAVNRRKEGFKQMFPRESARPIGEQTVHDRQTAERVLVMPRDGFLPMDRYKKWQRSNKVNTKDCIERSHVPWSQLRRPEIPQSLPVSSQWPNLAPGPTLDRGCPLIRAQN